MCGTDLSSFAISRKPSDKTGNDEPDNDKKSCRCRKSKCLKLYCECYASGEVCTDLCKCLACENTEHHRANRAEAKAALEARADKASEDSRQDATNTGRCNCRRSGCRKKYCECFNACIECTSACKCVDCFNKGGPIQVSDQGCADMGVTVWILADGAFTPTCSSIGTEEEMMLPETAQACEAQNMDHGLNAMMCLPFGCPPLGLQRDPSLTDEWCPTMNNQRDAYLINELSESLSDDQLEAVLRMMEAPAKRPRAKRVPSAEWGLAMQEGMDSDEDENEPKKRVKRSDSMLFKRDPSGVSLGRQMSDELYNKLVLGRSLSNERLALLMNTSDSDWNLMLTKQSSQPWVRGPCISVL
eukprot:TRINITY_DN13133_c0_g1_i4.p1 TRINITY_DN13133_c0_g1~~TRINITY_DN13133_c0_g1_i4.p1  ORF type:complete len:357 (-),score=87.54 TRINITY_DN13133_c0_g1_i4:156-1226(-)